MLCPVCRREMLTLEFRFIELDRCAECGGVWLDSGEIALVAEKAGALESALLSALEPGDIADGVSAGARRCPVCAKRLERVCAPLAGGVVVERCARRHGIWFDEGELDTAVRAAGAEPGDELSRFLAELAGCRRKGPCSERPTP